MSCGRTDVKAGPYLCGYCMQGFAKSELGSWLGKPVCPHCASNPGVTAADPS